jgi:aryl-alcohol dehydrogenase-like predicted oxidoreductase
MKRTLGASGLDVFPIGLGGMPMSIRGRPSEADAVRTIHAALDGGMDFIDTADVYCLDHTDIGHNERLIRTALRSWTGKRPIIATKGGLERPSGQWTRNGRPDHLRRACNRSLAALGAEAIDLYQLHAPDPDVTFEDSIGALADLVRAGKVRNVGLSNVSVAQIRKAAAIVPIASVQNRCHPFDRSAFTEGVVAHCEANGIAFLPYSPVGGSRGKDAVARDPTLHTVAARHGSTPFQVALAWLLQASPVVIPIPGASKPENAASSARAARLELTGPDRFQLDAAFPTHRA